MLTPGTFAPIKFDPATLFALAGAFSMLYAAMNASLRRTFPPSIPGLRDSTRCMAIIGLALFSVFVTSLAADGGDILIWHRLLNNLLIQMSAVFYAISMYRLAFKEPPVRLLAWMMAGHVVLAGYATFVPVDVDMQRAFSSVFIAATFGLAGWGGLMRPWRLNSGPRLAICASALMVAAVTAVRIFWVLFSDQNLSINQVNYVQLALAIAIALAVVGAGMSGPLLAGEALQTQITRSAMTDALTGLYCRRAFFEVVERRLVAPATARRVLPFVPVAAAADGSPPTGRGVLMIDVDLFKKINDTHGHQVGDRTIAACGGLVARAVRERDVAARYGGEEFVAFVDGAARADIESIADCLLTWARNSRSDDHPPFTVSIGAALLADGETLEQCIGRADAALYRAKREGRDRCVFDDPNAEPPATSAATEPAAAALPQGPAPVALSAPGPRSSHAQGEAVAGPIGQPAS